MSELNLYQQYSKIKKDFTDLKSEELKLRNKLIKMQHKTKFEGTENFNHPRLGVIASVVFGINRSVDEAVLDTIWDNLTTEEKEVIKYKPEVDIKKYRELEQTFPDSKIFDAIIEKESQPSLKIKEI